jgi:hypothetical protein
MWNGSVKCEYGIAMVCPVSGCGWAPLSHRADTGVRCGAPGRACRRPDSPRSARPQPGPPRMIRVDQAERRVQPAAFRAGQQRQHAGEVSLVLVPRVLCLEQQNGLDSQVRDPVVGTPDDLAVRPADPPFVTAADPDIPVVRLVTPPTTYFGVRRPAGAVDSWPLRGLLRDGAGLVTVTAALLCYGPTTRRLRPMRQTWWSAG